MHTKISPITKAVRLSQLLFFLMALAMAIFGVISLFRQNVPAWAAILMVVDAVLLGLAGWLITRRSSVFHLLAVGLVAGNAILTITDQFGWVDAVVLLIFLVLLALLVVQRRQFTTA
jgi:hypothetical protein